MLFGRKYPPEWKERLRVMLWPRRSWSRSLKYITKRVLRLTASPHAISAGVAAGIFASFTPFMGLHVIVAFVVGYIIAGNFLAAVTGTFFGNPITFPFIWASTYSLGQFILFGQTELQEPSLDALTNINIFETGMSSVFQIFSGIWYPILWPMLVGGIPLGVFFGILGYICTRWASARFREARRQRIKFKNLRVNQ